MTPLKIRRVVAAATMSALLGAGLVACGSDDDSKGSDDSSQDSESGDDANDETPTKLKGSGGGFDVAEGEEVDPAEFAAYYSEASSAEESAAVEQTITSGGQTVEYSGVTTFTPDDMRVSLEGDTNVIIVDNTLYTQLQPGSDEYVSIDLDDTSNPIGQAFAVTGNPEKAAEALGSAAQSVTYVGTTEVNGEDAATYDLVIDTAAFYTELGLADFAALVEDGSVPTELEQTVSFDSEDRVVQTIQTVPATDASPETVTEVTYTEFGVDVDVEAPATPVPFEEAIGG